MRIAAFDPSLLNLGVAAGVSEKDGFTLTEAATFKMDQLRRSVGIYGDDADAVDNTVRMRMLTRVVQFVIARTQPDVVVLEEPIFNYKNPKSLMVQSRAKGLLEWQIAELMRNICPYAEITTYMPNVIKLGVGVPNDKKEFQDKTAINRALYRLVERRELIYADRDLLPDNIDDHANDAVAMVMCKHLEIRRAYELV